MRFVLSCAFALSGLLRANTLLDFSYGALEESRGNASAASDFYEKAFLEDPLSMPLVTKVVQLRLAANDRSGAIRAYDEVLSARASEPMIQISFGDFLGNVGKEDAIAMKKREAAYQAASELLPREMLPIERLIRFARERGDDARARELLETLELEDPESVLYYVSTTKSLYDSKDEAAKKRVSEHFSKAIEAFPESPKIARSVSDYFREAGDLKTAIKVLEKHVAAVPSSLDLKIRMGILCFAAGRGEEGLRILNEVLEIHSKKALAHESLAKFYSKNNDAEKARFHTVELLKIRGGGADEFEELAVELLAAEKPRDARLLLEKGVFDHPENERLMMQLAIAAARDPEAKVQALRLFREAETMLKDSKEKDPSFLLEFAKELIAQGQSNTAEDRLRSAIRIFPKTANKETAAALRALAAIWTDEGRNLEAAKALISRAENLDK